MSAHVWFSAGCTSTLFSVFFMPFSTNFCLVVCLVSSSLWILLSDSVDFDSRWEDISSRFCLQIIIFSCIVFFPLFLCRHLFDSCLLSSPPSFPGISFFPDYSLRILPRLAEYFLVSLLSSLLSSWQSVVLWPLLWCLLAFCSLASPSTPPFFCRLTSYTWLWEWEGKGHLGCKGISRHILCMRQTLSTQRMKEKDEGNMKHPAVYMRDVVWCLPAVKEEERKEERTQRYQSYHKLFRLYHHHELRREKKRGREAWISFSLLLPFTSSIHLLYPDKSCNFNPTSPFSPDFDSSSFSTLLPGSFLCCLVSWKQAVSLRESEAGPGEKSLENNVSLSMHSTLLFVPGFLLFPCFCRESRRITRRSPLPYLLYWTCLSFSLSLLYTRIWCIKYTPETYLEEEKKREGRVRYAVMHTLSFALLTVVSTVAIIMIAIMICQLFYAPHSVSLTSS